MSDPSDIARLLERLRTPEAAGRLVDRWLADLMARPVAELVSPEQVGDWAQRLVAAALASDALHARVVTGIEDELRRAESDKRTLRQASAPELSAGALELARRPHSPDRALILGVLDREPMRKLIRALLIDVLIEFGRKVASVASPLTGSRVGRGLGALGAIAGAVGSGVVGAVSGELERQVEKRAAEFADLGISRVLQRLADLASDPTLAKDQADLRAALLEGVFDLRLSDLVADTRRQDPAGTAALIRGRLKSYAARPDLRNDLTAYLKRAWAPDLKKPLGEVLDGLGIRTEVEAAMRQALGLRAHAFDWAGWIEAELAGEARSS